MRFLKDKLGMELLEAAITTPIAILVMLAIVNLGMLIYAQQAVQAGRAHGQCRAAVPGLLCRERSEILDLRRGDYSE